MDRKRTVLPSCGAVRLGRTWRSLLALRGFVGPAHPCGVSQDLGAVLQVQAVHDLAHVVLDRTRTEVQPRADLFVRQAIGHQPQDLELPGAQHAFDIYYSPRAIAAVETAARFFVTAYRRAGEAAAGQQ